MTIEERFWSKVNFQDDDDCWQWIGAGAKTKHGYGRIRVDGRMRQITHVAWKLTHGTPVPPELVVHHFCDNPLCVNPQHLLLGTRKDSVNAAIASGALKVKVKEGRKFSD